MNQNIIDTAIYQETKHCSRDFIGIVENIISRIENYNDYDDMQYAIDSETNYYEDQWTILKEFCNPDEADLNYAMSQLIEIIENICENITSNL